MNFFFRKRLSSQDKKKHSNILKRKGSSSRVDSEQEKQLKSNLDNSHILKRVKNLSKQ